MWGPPTVGPCVASPCAFTSGRSFEVAGGPSTCYTHAHFHCHGAKIRDRDRPLLATTKNIHIAVLVFRDRFWYSVIKFTYLMLREASKNNRKQPENPHGCQARVIWDEQWLKSLTPHMWKTWSDTNSSRVVRQKWISYLKKRRWDLHKCRHPHTHMEKCLEMMLQVSKIHSRISQRNSEEMLSVIWLHYSTQAISTHSMCVSF